MKNILLPILFFSLFHINAQTPCVGGMAGPYPCSNYDLQSEFSLSELNAGSGNDSWGWTDPSDGKEYALVGLDNGTAFIDISNPINPVFLGKLPTHTNSSLWRDIKVYNNYAFVVSEASGHGMQVFDLTRLRTVSNPPITFTEDAHYGGFGNAHNIVINEDTGYAYGVGTNTFNGGPHFVNIQNPLNPIAAGGYSFGSYSHDGQVVTYNGPDASYQGREIYIGSNENEVVIVDVTNKANPVGISTITYPNAGYTHQGWLTEDHRYFLVGDEFDESNVGFDTRTVVMDLFDLDNPSLHFDYFGPTPAIDHNGYVKGNKFYLANYKSGIRVVDITDIANGNMSEIGFFDSYPSSNSASYDGAWNVYPYFGSGNIVISDMARGFLLVKSSIVDTTDPIAVCQNVNAQLDSSGQITINGSQVDGGSSDDSGFFTLSVFPNNFDCTNIGPNTVTLTVTDSAGNSDSCTATVTIQDNLAATFSCPSNSTVPYDAGQTYYTLPDLVASGDVSASDNCTNPLIIIQVPVAGTQLLEGTHTISFDTTDDEGNTSSCSFELTVQEVLGTTTFNLESGLTLFPNPATDLITIDSKNEDLSAVEITDISGKRLYYSENLNSNNHMINISSFTEGLYFITVNNTVSKKIIKN